MRTPDGKDCRHYYQDFHRGRALQECRLINENRDSLRWKPEDCAHCPVPGILQANASPNLVLSASIQARFLGLGRTIKVAALCLKHKQAIKDAHIGCEACNRERPGFEAFLQQLEGKEDD